MAQRSNGYILGFATAVCVVCSVFVSGAALSLKDQQVANAELDLKKNVISVSGLKQPKMTVVKGNPHAYLEQTSLTRILTGADSSSDSTIVEPLIITVEDVDKYFSDSPDRVELGYVDLRSGTVTERDVAEKYIKANKGTCEDLASKDNIAKISCLPKYRQVFSVYKNNVVDRIILSVEGKGLWSTLYGFLALSKDGTTIYGLTFYKHGETPGLGGEVDNPKWKKLWVGEQIPYSANSGSPQPQIDVVKGAAPTGVSSDGKIDGLSGATLTANGVEYLLNFWLGDHGYGPYVKSLSEVASNVSK
jgi:Na+-transporting NADH:ubiquinone oxidoreductase subunit C